MSVDNFCLENCPNKNSKDKYIIMESNYSSKIEYMEIINDNNLNFYKDNLVCLICKDLLYPPVSLTCGHSFCSNCLKNCEENNFLNNCPMCRSEIYDNNFKTNIVIKNIVDQVNCNCPLKCNWNGKLENINEHLKNCDNRVILCKWCKDPMEYKYLDNHLKEYCNYRVTKCLKCNRKGPYRYLNEHTKNCNTIKKTRPTKLCKLCKYKVPKNKFINHLKLCKKNFIKCKSCNKILNKNRLKYHSLIRHNVKDSKIKIKN